MRGKKKILLLLAILPLALLTKANNGNNGSDDRGKPEPAISGLVSETGTKKPVQGVTISISGKGQDKKELFTTDAAGNFKVPQMPAGELIIILEKKGYKTFRKEGVTLKEGVPLKLNFDISNEGADDESDVFHPLRMMDSE
ncbi:carboxypeptidase regulatory-like domain-containing protein [Paraflavitalea soli]|uniref:Carboxypeptidase regulatory-like domain-containing protein n=1 Tax=Paraflavitalea soli TaxID=2315862 RepID=A0A3B7MT90_9BACT|nr:carboxypeptidase-like regulatory domain-containing protein [Paraflavitalea soli]AXY77732.1 carboxypeptidase regulatory-like domain-containing protein [Paraflavitalea soli]